MNKNAIKKFAIDARNKLIASVTDKAGMLGITKDACSEPITKGMDFEVYKTTAGTEVTLNKKQCEHRRKLVEQIKARGFEAVIEEVAYTWFNRICAIRFMEVNDYMYPARVRVLSSEKAGKNEPDILTQAPDIDWNFTDEEREYIIDAKMNNKLDDLFRMLFIKQCNLLHEVLPGLFEETEDYTEVLLNISFTNEDDVIRMLIDSVDEADFNVSTLDENGNPTGQVEIIGWLYQYYNTELKDDTFAKLKKNIKISKERIPAATQLFTPDWIVRYMVENSVGRIWIEHLRANDPSVDEKAIAERFGWQYYLPEAEQEDEVNVKLTEIRTTYKDLKPTDITCIDPCMGSGHILIAMFDVLMDIYESAGYDKREAAFDIVEYNIHGLDIDKRAYQLAYFAVMMKGRGYNRRFFRGRDDVKPAPKVYAIRESNDINNEQIQYFGYLLQNDNRNRALLQIRNLLKKFVNAKEYGSIIRAKNLDYTLLYDFLNSIEDIHQVTFETLYLSETQEKLIELCKVSQIINDKYDVVVTNPPYMGNGGMNDELSEMLKLNYPNSKNDMSTVFMEAYLNSIKPEGYLAMINIPVWMFIKSYSNLRRFILENYTITNMLHLGRGVFGADFGTTSFVIKGQLVKNYEGVYKRLFTSSSAVEDVEKKMQLLADKTHNYLQKQDMYRYVPEMNLAYWANEYMISAFRGKDGFTSLFERQTDADEKTEIEITSKFARKNSKNRDLAELLKETIKEKQKNQLFLYKLYDNGIKRVEPIMEWFRSIQVIFPNTKVRFLPIRISRDTDFQKFISDSLNKMDTGVVRVSAVSDEIDFHDFAEKSHFPKKLIQDIEEKKHGMFSIGGKYYIFGEKKEDRMMLVQIKFEHRLNSKSVEFDLEDESDGTQRLLDLLPMLFAMDKKATNIYIVDEIDRSLHTRLSKYLLNLFLNSSADTNNQIIYTAHDVNLIDLNSFSQDEIWFVEKKLTGETTIKPMSDFNINKDSDVLKAYLNGRFGAVPVIKGV